MRLWTVHPTYLDPQGLVALWREGLLAQKVLKGETKGYRNHPQLLRFKMQPDPVGAIASYLWHIHDEAFRRGYEFDKNKLASAPGASLMTCTEGQLLYEWEHLKNKLRQRHVRKYAEIERVNEPEAHPIFRVVAGDVEVWEVSRARESSGEGLI